LTALFVLGLLTIHTAVFSEQVREVKIGVLAKRGPEFALKKWSATADYLSTALPDYHFTIVPLGFEDIHTTVQQAKIDFILANSAFYVELEKLYGVSRIATLINQNLPGQYTTIFGGVILVRSDRADIKEIDDLRGHSFMAVDPFSFGGWIMCRRELHQRGIDPTRFFSSLSYGKTHDAVVYAVRNGDVDGGTVRSDTLERMVDAGSINLDEFLVLNEQQNDNFPFKRSTALYPEWPFAAVKSTSVSLARKVTSALLAMDENTLAAKSSKSAGWTVPLNYQPVHDCLLELRIGPYADFGQFTLSDVVRRYWKQLALLLLMLITVSFTSLYILQLNRRLKQKKQEVDEFNKTLETKIEEGTKKVYVLLDQELYLREIMQTISEINGLLLSTKNLDILLQGACRILGEHGHYSYIWIGLLQNNLLTTVFSTNDSIQSKNDLPYDLRDPKNPFSVSPAAQCMMSKQTVVAEKSSVTSIATPWLEGESVSGYRSVVALPLRADKYSSALGALCVYTLRPEGFEEEEISMLEELAGDIGFAISSFRHRELVTKLETERTANYEETILSFANMIDQRDTYTAGHTTRVAHYCKLLAEGLGLGEEQIGIVQRAATLHDIGKIATPDSVLLKPGQLSALDYDLIKLHASAGYDMLVNIASYQELAGIIRHHHERYDGKGYPDRLKGKDISLLSRVIVVADAFDAMTTNRIYKPRKVIEEALRELQQLSGIQFDPDIVAVAQKVFKDVNVPESITQLPKTQMEQRRFSYFFSDKVTGLYNEDYLQIILQNNKDLQEYPCLHSLHIRNLQQYNQEQGWENGNMLMQKFAVELRQRYPDTLLFRVYGQYFVIIAKRHFDMLEEGLEFDTFKGTGVNVGTGHFDLKRDTAYYIEKMEKFEIQSREEAEKSMRQH
jgi:putative nucleotidyltransferase with HDIG domain